MTYRILTVCTGNICRSPMAEVVLADQLAAAGLDAQVDSAAVTTGELGNPIDYRAVRVLRGGGYDVPIRQAQLVQPADFADYDLILPMTEQHEWALERIRSRAGQAASAEVRLFRSFVDDGIADVPDPWYGDESDFVETLTTIEAAAPAITEYVRQQAG